MKHYIHLCAVALGIAWLYAEALALTIGVAVSLSQPSWWASLFPTHTAGIAAWMVLCHTIAILVVALPFAYAIARIYGRLGIVLALGLTLVLYGFDPLPAVVSTFQSSSARM